MHQDNFSQLEDLAPVLNQIWHEHYAQVPDSTGLLYNVQSSAKAKETDLRIGSFTEPSAWQGQVEYDSPDPDYEIEYRHTKYQRGFTVTRELFDDLQYDVPFSQASAMATAFARKRQKDAMSVFNNGFSSSYLGYDSKALFANDHPRSKQDSTSVDNYLGTIALTADNLDTAITTLEGLKDDKGYETMAMATVLLVGRNNRKKALELTESELNPETANNAINTFSGLQTLYSPFITGNYWFVIDGNMARMVLRWFDRTLPTFESMMDFDRDVLKNKGTMRYSYGWSDFRFAVGANPS